MRRVAVLLALVCAGCSGGDDAKTTNTTSREGPTVSTAAVSAAVDWKARTVEIDGFDEYDVDFCEGEAPLLCVADQGVIELLTRPEAGELADGPTQWATRFASSLENDRRHGCDVGYTLTLDPTADAPVAGRAGFRYSFTGKVGADVVERVVGYGVVRGGRLHLLVMNALADNGCLPRESELPLHVAAELEPVLAALAAGSSNLPSA